VIKICVFGWREGTDVQRESDGLQIIVLADNLVGARVGRPPPEVGVQADVFENALGGLVVPVAVISKLSFPHVEMV
jgi:hypothetical protein